MTDADGRTALRIAEVEIYEEVATLLPTLSLMSLLTKLWIELFWNGMGLGAHK